MLWSLLPSTLFPPMFRFLVKAITESFILKCDNCVKKFLAPCISKLTVLSINLILISMISRPYSALSEVGNVWSVNDWSQSFSKSAGSNIPSPGRSRWVKCPTPEPTKTIKFPPHDLRPPPPPPSPPRLHKHTCFPEPIPKIFSSSAVPEYKVHLALGY